MAKERRDSSESEKDTGRKGKELRALPSNSRDLSRGVFR
jgi:hypothetical protein